MLKVSCACDAGYVCRVARSHLARWGAPLCPACMRPMDAPEGIAVRTVDPVEDVFAGLGEMSGAGPEVVQLEAKYVKLRAERACMDCGRTHQRGWSMLFNRGRVRREIVRGWFCASGCEAPVETEHPGGAPRGFRLTAEHGNGQTGFSAHTWNGLGQGHGTGARS